MAEVKIDSKTLIPLIIWVLKTAIGLFLLFLVLGTVASELGLGKAIFTAVAPTKLAYICGAYWLVAGRI